MSNMLARTTRKPAGGDAVTTDIDEVRHWTDGPAASRMRCGGRLLELAFSFIAFIPTSLFACAASTSVPLDGVDPQGP
jgi:hypothetical protein